MMKTLPAHLSEYAVEQHYEKYTPINQAVWRYVMRQNHHFLMDRAHPVYAEGLAASGIPIDSIPNIDVMDQCLGRIGWAAVTVDGFIPPSVFMDFQAHKILPIASDMRTLDHISYTPAPDIIHESAGHAPILLDPRFATFVSRICELGVKALATKADHDLYDAIRHLSIVKEDPTATPEEIAEAEATFEQRQAAVTETSEASYVSRFYWWTVEYGLIGDLERPKIYGAGLLSSVGESKRCLGPEVKKVPFSLDAVLKTAYDITTFQPQLFVCEDFEQLVNAVDELKQRMACTVGGTVGLETAVKSANVAIATYSSGLRVKGIFTELLYDDQGQAVYLRTTGPTRLKQGDRVLPGHDESYHREGFGAPIGKLAGVETPIEEFTDAQRAEHQLVVGQQADLTFESGVRLKGRVTDLRRIDGKLALVAFEDCTVTLGDRVLFAPEWGTFDMAVGERITGVEAGADLKLAPSREATRQAVPAFSAEELGDRQLQELYHEVREMRSGSMPGTDLMAGIRSVWAQLDRSYPADWLLRLELLELMSEHQVMSEERDRLVGQLKALETEPERTELIENGLSLI